MTPASASEDDGMKHRWIEPTRRGAWLWMPMRDKGRGVREGYGETLSVAALRELRAQADEALRTLGQEPVAGAFAPKGQR